MDHFPLQSWLELARGICTPEQKDQLEEHLRTNCSQCQRAFEFWTLVVKMGSREATYRPSDDQVEWAKQAFRSRPIEKAPATLVRFARLVFDSFLQPSMATVRKAGQSDQQLLFETDSLAIDLHRQYGSGKASTFLTGQIMSAEAEPTNGEAEVVLLSGDRELLRTRTSSQGEFELEVGEERDMTLRIEMPNQEPVLLSLPDPKQE